ncbi:hypothetical protein CBM2592_B180082 [Cupriavidus taiwanensis]|nr:hypothetical protein CBM2592_B180082 [Cupriavidus taiwanensis]SOY69905.1 hypothetical protein CBM2588_B200082 [Cupriavidus taiwanensis]SOY95324.1 hypothetical protein CBM2591_B170080 [Cupriavidus taiwanensis]SOZ87255.1 hypothetical protein CBM2618_B200287 [Cupriavidus taiwanensis]SOZ90290.1 hypothetical protein CBM2622_B190290 [Cupriavidus taiwanensis]
MHGGGDVSVAENILYNRTLILCKEHSQHRSRLHPCQGWARPRRRDVRRSSAGTDPVPALQ